jgi:hypothetical protein
MGLVHAMTSASVQRPERPQNNGHVEVDLGSFSEGGFTTVLTARGHVESRSDAACPWILRHCGLMGRLPNLVLPFFKVTVCNVRLMQGSEVRCDFCFVNS